jgi:hypothetical protein
MEITPGLALLVELGSPVCSRRAWRAPWGPWLTQPVQIALNVCIIDRWSVENGNGHFSGGGEKRPVNFVF